MGNIDHITDLYSFCIEDEARVRATMINGEVCFVLVDICVALGISNRGNVTARLDSEDIRHADIPTAGGAQRHTLVTEYGLYDLVIRSDKPKAAQFRRWITHEVIPAIRRTGGYQLPDNLPEALRLAAQAIEERNQAREIAATAMASATHAERQVRAIAPSAGAWDHLSCGRGSWNASYALRVLRKDPALKTITADQYRVAVFRVGIARWDERRKVFHLSPNAIKAGLAAGSDTSVRVTPKGLALIHAEIGGSKPLSIEQEDLDALVVDGELVDTPGPVVA